MYKSILTSAILLVSYHAFAGDCSVQGMQSGNVYNGKTHCENAHLSSLTVNDFAQLSQVHVASNATIHGYLLADQVYIKQNITVDGKASLTKSIVNGDGVVKGKLMLNHSNIHDVSVKGGVSATSSIANNMTITGRKVLLDSSHAKSITFKPDDNKNQYLCLLNHSKINGNVVFAAKNGKVYVDSSSSIIGKVEGGVVEKADCPFN